MAIFKNRSDAGKKLAKELSEYEGREDVVALALPRGGLPVAYEVARALKVPLDVFLVQKLGVPGYEDLAMGAISSGGGCVMNPGVVETLSIPETVIDAVVEREQIRLRQRESIYRGERSLPPLAGRVVILVDDGLATGFSMRAAIAGLRQHRPAQIVVAVPVAAPGSRESLRGLVDRVICISTPQPFVRLAQWYQDFTKISDLSARELLNKLDEDLRAQEGEKRYREETPPANKTRDSAY